MNLFINYKEQNFNNKILSRSLLSIITLWIFLLFGCVQSVSAAENLQTTNIIKNISWLKNTATMPVLESITITTESTTLISGSRKVHIKATGSYSDGKPRDITSLVNWKYDDRLISKIDNDGLITVANITNNTTSNIIATDPITKIKSNFIALKFESITLQSITINIESTTLISGSKNISVTATGHYNNGESNITRFVHWNYDNKLINSIDNNGLINVGLITTNTTSTISATDPVTKITSNIININFESVTITKLAFDPASQCYTSDGTTSCQLILKAWFNDGTPPKPQFVDFKGNLKDIFSKTTSTPVARFTNAFVNQGVAIELDYDTLLNSVTPNVGYNGVTATGSTINTSPLRKSF